MDEAWKPGSDPIDTDTIEALAGAIGADGVVDLIDLYFEESHERVAQCHLAAANGELGTLRQRAHPMKSSSRYLGAFPLSDTFAALESAAANGELERARSLAGTLVGIVSDTHARLKDIRQQLDGKGALCA